ncbi:hypothetical protein ACKUV4_015470 [Acinetobacter baumannii]
MIILVKTSEILMADGGQVENCLLGSLTLVDGTTVHNYGKKTNLLFVLERFVSLG